MRSDDAKAHVRRIVRAAVRSPTLSSTDLTQLREWIAGIAHPAESLALIEQAAQGRRCPHCHCPLISDAANAYHCFAREAGITHEAVNVAAGQRARGAIHIQNVNAWHNHFISWLVRFRGVASRYLANYSGWKRLLGAGRLSTPIHWLCAAIERI